MPQTDTSSKNEPAADQTEDKSSHDSSQTDTHHSAEGHVTAPAPLESLFDRKEIAQFDADDVQAGRAIGKMLSLFFLYTIIAMSFVAWWTYRSVFE